MLQVILGFVFTALKVGAGLGFVIFVHELGHFLVAKACGVKCEKFYLGFDFGGFKICKFQWGETEYGIGIFPLGGYVKMLGQEDNPTRLQEEIDRAKQTTAADAAIEDRKEQIELTGDAETVAEATVKAQGDAAVAKASVAPPPVQYDPRSFLAKSVPQRMAIIVAGVTMNVIFAFIMASVAYSVGVEYVASGHFSEVFSGCAAWRAGIEPGDSIVEAAGKKVERFTDLTRAIGLGDLEHGIAMKIRRPGQERLIETTVYPDRVSLGPSIGVANPARPALVESGDVPPYLRDASAAKAEPKLQGGDKFILADSSKINDFADLNRLFFTHRSEPIKLLVIRTTKEKSDDTAITTFESVVPPNPMHVTGMVMTMGEVSVVQEKSPAAKVGIKVRDKIVRIDDQPIADPMKFPEQVSKRAGDTVKLTVDREGESAPLEFTVLLRKSEWAAENFMPNSPVAVNELGIGYRVLNRVADVVDDSLADKAGVKQGDVIQQVKLIVPASDETKQGAAAKADSDKIVFSDQLQNWPHLMCILQRVPLDTELEMTFEDGRVAKFKPTLDAKWFNPDRGFNWASSTVFQKAYSILGAAKLGARETGEQLTSVVKFLRKIGSQISPKALGGPVEIIKAAGAESQHGFARFLIFLTFLSANLAILNVIPIPLLDGGHLLFLAYEGIRGKPADERVQIALSYLGLFLLLGLMIFVLGLDFGLISRH